MPQVYSTSRFDWEFGSEGSRWAVLYVDEMHTWQDGQLGIKQLPDGAWANAQTGRLFAPSFESQTGGNGYDPGHVSQNGFWYGLAGVTRAVLTNAALVGAGILCPPLGVLMLAGAIGYGVYDYRSRVTSGEGGAEAAFHTFGDLSGLESINQAITNPKLDSYEAGQAFGNGVVQFSTLALGAGYLAYRAPRVLGYEWAIGTAEADGTFVLGSTRLFRRAKADAKIAIRFDEELGSDAYELHHSDPEFMGGARDQKRTSIETSEHDALHNEMNTHLDQYTDVFGHTMRPGPSNSAQRIQMNFTRAERLNALADFYNRVDVQSRWWEASRDFFNQHPHLKAQR
jgi:hypothetical protein